MSLLEDITAELHVLRARGELRSPDDGTLRGGRPWVDVSSNDYLGLGRRSVSRETLDALTGLSQGAGASRLIHGERPVHVELERFLADWVRQAAALSFSSAYAANAGVLAALAGPGDLIVSDALNHASIIDGCRLSGARVCVVPHGDVGAIAEALRSPARRRWVVVEGYYSMDGRSPDLVRLRALSDEAGAGLVVDEAHALGVLGPSGAGVAAEQGVRADVVIGAFGKAVGFQGGFVAARAEVIQLLWNRARTFVFSTATSPAVAAMGLAAARRTREADDERARLARHCQRLAAALAAAGVPTPPERRGPIFPIILGSNDRALRAASALREAGFLTQAIRPPTVPEGTARLRITAHATLGDAEIDALARAVEAACRVT